MKNEKILINKQDENQILISNLFSSHKNNLTKHLLNIHMCPETAQDIIQEVFLKLCENTDILQQVKHPDQYIFYMARNLLFNLLKRKRIESQLFESIQKEHKHSENQTESDIYTSEIKERFKTIFKQLSPQQQQIYRLSRIDQLKHKEIARQLNLSLSTVNNHLTQANHIIQKELKKYFINIIKHKC